MRRQLLFLTLALIIGASMSLFDIDRHNDDRGNPAPNHSDSLTDGSIKSHGTFSTNYVTDASNQATATSLRGGFLRLVSSGTYTLTLASVNSTVAGSIEHGLGYVPLVVVTIQEPPIAPDSDSPFYPVPVFFYNSSTNYLQYLSWTDTTYVHFQISVGTSARLGAYNFRYYVMAQTAN